MAYRILYRLDGEVRRRLLSVGENLLGSDNACDVVIDHPSVSRHHAALVIVENPGDGILAKVEVADLNSRNGTRIENQRVRGKAGVELSQSLTFGSVEATIETVAEADAEVAHLPSFPRESGGLDEVENEHRSTALASRMSHTTASVGPLSVFVLGYLPGLTGALAAGTARHTLAQRAGGALLESLPCRSVTIHWGSGPGSVALFEGTGQGEGRVEARGVVGQARVAADLRDEETRSLLEPLLEAVAGLICAADRTNESAPEPRPTIDRRPSSDPMVPDPPSVEPAVREVYERALKVAPSDVNVLILGESGTGKELLARYLHQASDRSNKPFVAMNCAALPKDLQESELFGIERGVATGVEARAGLFEQAHGGTIFLDEIGDMAKDVQAKILRVLQEKEVFRLGGKAPHPADVRILSATHHDVGEMLKTGEFRTDLFHRIADWQAQLPALRHRVGDIGNLVAHFLGEAAEQGGAVPIGVSRAALAALCNYSWPGNIRQLEREIRRAVLFVDPGELLDTSCLSEEVAATAEHDSSVTLKSCLLAAERSAIETALARVDGDVGKAAEALDVPVSTLYRKIKVLEG